MPRSGIGLNELLGGPGIATSTGLRLPRDTYDVAQISPDLVDDVTDMLQLLALDAGEFHLMGCSPFACRSGSANGKHEVSPALWAEVRMEFDDE